MTEHVFKKADRLSQEDWVRDITGREFTPDDYLDYLEEKYSRIYEL
jgi:carboxypeptidase Taq